MTRVRYDNDTKLDGMLCLIEHVSGNPHAIEDAETHGQQRLVTSTQLPIKGTEDEAPWLAIGVKLGEKTDELFRDAELPPGWRLRPTEHSMWSDLLDEKGRKRAAVFYKAAFYDRRAHVVLVERYAVSQDYRVRETVLRHHVTETIGGEEHVLFRSSELPAMKREWDEQNTIREAQTKECADWLDANRPNWRDRVKSWKP